MAEALATRPSFNELLQKKWDEGKFLCVGLDPDFDKLPPHPFKEYDVNDPKQGWNTRQLLSTDFLIPIIDATADQVCAYKPNLAFYEFFEHGPRVLQHVIDHIHGKYPDVAIIGDGKRADIGKTNRGYARMAFDPTLGGYYFDAMTTNPYFGHETYAPFLEYKGKGLIAMCKTSNPDAAMYQDVIVDLEESVKPKSEDEKGIVSDEEFEDLRNLMGGETKIPFYYLVAYRHGRLAEKNPNIGIVVGATHPEAFEPVRKLYGEGIILIPGLGTQGGDLELTVKYAPNKEGKGVIYNNSSAITFASKGPDFAEAAGAKAAEMNEQIAKLRAA